MKKKILQINNRLIKCFGVPERKYPLPSPLSILIGTILSQNTNDNNSFIAYKNLKSKFPDWTQAANARLNQIENEIKVAGLWKQKAKAIKSVLKYFKEKDSSLSLDYLKEMDSDSILNELTSFKGVGIKTASCVLLFSLDRNVCPVDTHVFRTLNRIGLVQESTPEKTFYAIKNNIPDRIAHPFHTNLIRLGRKICKPQKPLCGLCPLKRVCMFDDKNINIVDAVKNREFMLLDSIYD